MKNVYIGHPSQESGVFEMKMERGKADGMRILDVRNGKGLELMISPDRCADLPYLYFKGINLAYIAPCGLVSPQYYDNKDTGFLKSFTAGFFTTCGLTNFGVNGNDGDEELPMHGTIANVPAESVSYKIEDDFITVSASVRDASLFGRQLLLEREYRVSRLKNSFSVTDHVTNLSSKETPYMILYHCNMGYPLLSEESVLSIPSIKVEPRNERALDGISDWSKVASPTPDFEEQCYFHTMPENPVVSIYNPNIKTELKMTYNREELDCFTQWKMLGENEYVMGLEPGNAYPDGRVAMREQGILKYLKQYETKTNRLEFELLEK